MTQKVFALIDCNSFYCSCERLFRPELNGKPVIVLSNNDGCAIARTSEAKKLGIKMAQPFFKIEQFCIKNNITVFSCNFSIYTNISMRVMNTLAELCPQVEIYSVDEAFADLSGITNLTEHGHSLKDTILQNIGIPTCVGIGPTKVLAKLANNIAKKSAKAKGVVNLMDKSLRDVALTRVPVEDIWGIGRASSEKLRAIGINTALEFKNYKNEKRIQQVFTRVGLQIKHELMGISCFPLGEDIEKKKEIMCSRTFGQSIFDKGSLKESVANYITDASRKMRKQHSLCCEISVFANTNQFKDCVQYNLFGKIKLANPTCDTRKLIMSAYEIIDREFREGIEYKKAGIKLSGLYNSNSFQLDLLGESDSVLDITLMKTIDRINQIEGKGVLKFGACGLTQDAWKMNRKFKSPRYLTSWGELKVFK